MKKILIKIALLFIVLNISLFANEQIFNSVGINVGKSYTNNSQDYVSGEIILGNNPEQNFDTVEIFATLNPLTKICKEYNMKPYLSYTYSKNNDLKHQYFLFGVNKYYTPAKTKVDLYAGVLGGYGQIDWDYDPLNSSISKNVDANSFIGGVQVGATYPLNKEISLNLNTKYLLHKYQTNLEDISTNAVSVIEHNYTSTISLGFIYSF